MSDRRYPVGVSVLFAFSLTWLLAGSGARKLVRLDDGASAPTASEAERRFIEKQKRQFTQRPDWWPWADGMGLAAYGHVAPDELRSPDVLILPNGKGSIHIRGGSDRDRLPTGLLIYAEREDPLRKAWEEFVLPQVDRFDRDHYETVWNAVVRKGPSTSPF